MHVHTWRQPCLLIGIKNLEILSIMNGSFFEDTSFLFEMGYIHRMIPVAQTHTKSLGPIQNTLGNKKII